jgi:hypothetical protein
MDRTNVVREIKSLVITKIFGFRTTCGDCAPYGHHLRVRKARRRDKKPRGLTPEAIHLDIVTSVLSLYFQ